MKIFQTSIRSGLCRSASGYKRCTILSNRICTQQHSWIYPRIQNRHFSNRNDVHDPSLNNAAINESVFHRLADEALDKCVEAVDDLDDLEDVMYDEGVLKIETENGKHIVINKHFITRQIWYSSPKGEAMYFDPPFDQLLERLKKDLRECGVKI